MGVNISALASIVSKKEGKIQSVSHGNIREVLAILSDLIYGDTVLGAREKVGAYAALFNNGRNRARRRPKSARKAK